MKRPLRTACIVPSLAAAGMENVVVNLCNQLTPDEFRPLICTLAQGGKLESEVDRDRVELLNVPRRFGNDPRVPLRLAAEFRRRRIDLVQTNSWGTLVEGFVAARLARVPVVVHAEYGTMETRRRNVYVQRLLWRGLHRVVAVCDPLADTMAETIGFPRERIDVIPVGVDTRRFRMADSDKNALRRQLGLPQDVLLLGMVARFIPLKDHEGVIQALARLSQAGIELHLALAGDGPLRTQLEAAARELQVADRVHFLGIVPQVEPVLRALDILVSNSHREGMSVTIVEAMASGLPVVATDVGAAEELLAAGAAGVLIRPRDADALVAAIHELAQQPARRRMLGQAARQRAEAVFSTTAMVEGYARMYQELFRQAG
jgi:sugar transferase (PEP-CTERM/EpsH1 system associated)